MKKNLSFYLAIKRTDSKGLAPIYGQVTIKSKNYPFLIEKVKPRYWNKTKQRVNKPRETEPDNRHEEINRLIESLAANTERFDRFEAYNTAPDVGEVKKVFFQTGTRQKNFGEAYQEFIDANRNRVKPNTTRSRNTAKEFIQNFEKARGISIQFSDINRQLFEDLYDYALNVAKLENNAFAAYVAKFKAFIDWANEKEYCSITEHKKYKFSEKDKNVICLTVKEFDQLLNHDFKNERLNKTRDLYCFGCLTGLRFSDIVTMKQNHIQGDYIVKSIQKTSQQDKIPILPQARKIIKKYSTETGLNMPRISNVNLNKYIKECCQLAGIDETINKLIYRGTEVFEVPHPKYKLITVHTARKTFVSILMNSGMDPHYIMKITGHKKPSTFDKYAGLNTDKLKDEIGKYWPKDTDSIKLSFTASIEKNVDGSCTGLILEVPKAAATGKNIDELVKNLGESLKMHFEKQRLATLSKLKHREIIQREIKLQ